MNLQLNSKQFIQLYELIISTMSTCQDVERKATFSEIKLKLTEKLESILHEFEGQDNSKKLTTWIQKESEKINQLNDDLMNLKNGKMTLSSLQDDGLHYPPEVRS